MKNTQMIRNLSRHHFWSKIMVKKILMVEEMLIFCLLTLADKQVHNCMGRLANAQNTG